MHCDLTQYNTAGVLERATATCTVPLNVTYEKVSNKRPQIFLVLWLCYAINVVAFCILIAHQTLICVLKSYRAYKLKDAFSLISENANAFYSSDAGHWHVLYWIAEGIMRPETMLEILEVLNQCAYAKMPTSEA